MPSVNQPTPEHVESSKQVLLAGGVAPKEEVRSVGMGWSKVWHEEYQCYFYRHDDRQEVQWEMPEDLMPEPQGGSGDNLRFKV